MNEDKPRLVDKIKSVSEAVTDAAIRAARGEQVITPKTQKDERLEICYGCKFYLDEVGQCGKCGCVMEIKASLAGSKCPIGEWHT